MSYLYKEIPLSRIESIKILVTNCTKTLSQIKSSTQADYIINGGMWNADGSPCPLLKVDGKMVSIEPWTAYGYGWNTASDIKMTATYSNLNNFIAVTPLILNSAPLSKLSYGSSMGGKRGRTAMGLKNGALCLYCSQDGTSDVKTPETLRDYCFELGWESGMMFDGGGSSMCDFAGQQIKGDGRKVHNWICVTMKKENNEDTTTTDDKDYTITTSYITLNKCYTNQTKCNKTKMMLHSTGTPGGTASDIRNSMNKASAIASVEFVIDDTGIYQLLPLGIKSWHCGSTANNTHIACEICEPIQTRVIDENWYPLYRNGKNNTTWAVTQLQKELTAWGYDPNGIDGSFGPGCEAAVKKFQQDNGLSVDGSVGPATKAKLATRKGSYLLYSTYLAETQPFFEEVYDKAVNLFAKILKQIDGKASEIVCHSEGYDQGIASNHADVMHWFPEHGKTMDDFRADVQKVMNGETLENNTPVEEDKEDPNVQFQGVADWALESWTKAYNKIGIDGKRIIDGTRPTVPITRQEFIVVLNRCGQL